MNIINRLSLFALSVVAFVACEDYLDKSPEDVGLSESVIYSDYESFSGYLDNAYNYLVNYHGWNEHNNQRGHIGAISDELASLYNASPAITVNGGSWLSLYLTNWEIGNNTGHSIGRAYSIIRITSTVINTIQNVVQITPEETNLLLGQAHMLRAWGYFELLRRYGGMPIFSDVLYGDGDDDLPRKTYHESHDWMITDLDKAIAYLPDMWGSSDVGRPNKVAAMALKAHAMMYDASPLMQNSLEETTIQDYDKSRALKAAQYTQTVIDYITSNPKIAHLMATGVDNGYNSNEDTYKNIFYWTPSVSTYRQPEMLWWNHTQATDMTSRAKCQWLNDYLSGGTGNYAVPYNAPTENMVELYERKGDSGIYYPITDARSGYTTEVAATDHYSNRDPRFENNILRSGEMWGVNGSGVDIEVSLYDGGTMSTYFYTNASVGAANKREMTGYMCKKFIWPEANQWTSQYALYRVVTVYLRVAHMYLNYAEMAFEATGSATVVPDGCKLTAEEALNVIRNRAGITDLPSDYVSDATLFRESYRRERAVELMFEDSRWWDLRRWMIAHTVFETPIKNIKVTKSGTTFNYETVNNSVEVRVFAMRNYWYPFSMSDVASLDNLVQNPGW